MKRAFYLTGLVLAACWWWQPAAHGTLVNSLLPFEKTPPHLTANAPSPPELIRSLKLQTTNQPGDPEVWYQLGLAYAQNNQTDFAVAALQKAVGLDPVHVLAWENLGVNLYFNHQSEEAAKAFKRAVDLGATDPEVWNGYGLILLDLSRLPESEAALNQGLKISTHSRRLWNSLGLLRMKEGKNPDAMQAFQQALQVDPEYAIAWNNLGVIQAQSGTDDAGAQVSFQKATQFDPKLVQAWRSLACLYIKKRDPVDANNAARQVTKLLPGDVDGWLILGQSARSAEDWPTVVDAYHRAIDEIGLGDSFPRWTARPLAGLCGLWNRDALMSATTSMRTKY